MLIILNNFAYHYEIEQFTRMFTQDLIVQNGSSKPQHRHQNRVYVRMGKNKVLVAVYYNNVLYKDFADISKDKSKLQMDVCIILYKFYTKAFEKTLDWGVLTGVRPVRLMRNLYAKNNDIKFVEKLFKEKYFVSEEKTKLCLDIYNLQKPILDNLQKKDYSLYISIPFCPSKCSYCSFISTPSKNSQDLMAKYVDKLCQEIDYTAKITQKLGLNLKTVYIGGGTPTAITAQQLKTVMHAIKDNFDLSLVSEYTVEAGRPDCTDIEKLLVIKDMGADRVSINPQTFSNEVLAAIGRKHTHQDFLDCYNKAKQIGFKSINTDLIAGLPLDTVQGFENSVKGCIDLGAENITVHTLTIKRASALAGKKEMFKDTDVAEMLKKTKILTDNGYKPYYMYRQKSTLQSLENIGFSLSEHESLYNIYIMEEIQSIISCGAGAVTKIVGGNAEIKRIYNYKYPNEYINDFEQILKRKDEVYSLWQQFGYQNG